MRLAVVVAALNANVGVLGPLLAEEDLGGATAWSVIVAAQALGTIAGAEGKIELGNWGGGLTGSSVTGGGSMNCPEETVSLTAMMTD